jgi:hypothetical protein
MNSVKNLALCGHRRMFRQLAQPLMAANAGLPPIRRLLTSPHIAAAKGGTAPATAAASGEKSEDNQHQMGTLKQSTKDHFAAGKTATVATESDVEKLLLEIEASMPHPIWTQEQLNSVKVFSLLIRKFVHKVFLQKFLKV